jgi:outer membrane receptor protein involved in Fe transport
VGEVFSQTGAIDAVNGLGVRARAAVGGHVDNKMRRLGSFALLTTTFLVSSSLALAQVAPVGGIEEVLVTAQRHTESIQSVPISMDAITGATLDNLGDKNFFDYATSIPNLTVGIGAGQGGNGSGFGVSSSRAVTIRGVAGNNTSGFYLNDTPLPLSLDPRVIDLERVEVLRGPQGTLFGAGSMGGTVRLITRQPSLEKTSGKLDLEASAVSHAPDGGYSANGTLNLPLVQGQVALRVSAFSAFEPGSFTREWGFVTSPPVPLPPGAPKGEKTGVAAAQETGAMASLAIAPAGLPGLTITPTFIYQRSISNGYPLADFTPSNLLQIRPLNVPEAVDDTWEFVGLTATYDAGYGRFVGSGTYFYRNAYDLEDGTEFTSAVFPGGLANYVAAPLSNNLYTKTRNGEVRFESALHGPVQFVIGAFSELAQVRFYEPYPVPGLNAASGGVVGTDRVFFENAPNANRQRAEFLNVSYDVTSALQFSAGVRRAYLSHEFTLIDGGFGVSVPPTSLLTSHGFHAENDTSPRYTAKYQFAPDQMIYASAAKGFRIGGSNSPLPTVCDAALAKVGIASGAPFNSDSLWSYEIGTKNSWFGGRVKSRLAAYRIDWNGIQQTTTLGTIDPICGFNVTTNSGAAVSTGGELEVDAAPVDNLTLNFAAGYEDAKITAVTPGSLTVVGQPLNQVPKWTGSATAQYSVPLGERALFVRGQYTFTGARTSFVDVAPPTGRQLGAYSLVNLRFGVDQGPWEVGFFARNLFDVRANLGDVNPEVGELPGRPRWLIATPRTIGLQLRRDF